MEFSGLFALHAVTHSMLKRTAIGTLHAKHVVTNHSEHWLTISEANLARLH